MTVAELDKFSDLVGHIYDAALDPQHWPVVLEQSCLYLNGLYTTLASHDIISSTLNMELSWGIEPGKIREYIDHYIRYNEYIPMAQALGAGETVCMSEEAVLYERWKQTPLYSEWARSIGLVDGLQVTLDRPITGFALFGVARHADQGLVDETVRHRAMLLYPHLRRSILIGRVLDLHKVEAAALADALDGLEAGFFLVGARARLIHANRAGFAMLGRGSAATRLGERLALTDPRADAALRTVLRAAESGDLAVGSQGTAIPVVAGDAAHYVAHVLPLGTGARRRARARYDATAAVFVRQAAIAQTAALAALVQLYGLTPAEERVVRGIVEVGGVPQVAESFGVSEATVKSHLKSIFEKTGAKRQADLVRLVGEMASPLAVI
ncbi:hypothetical protein OPKNFCMD_6697 [Methylobacterium crusticola]|uniref:HTH luxR-type domain-containing protein n=1 Tax=Methylobacterium crusticola TaxID=1697972 RepID=A0ABQ4R860_9HYPH|nr:helix-turn-helix transcriptional regulator [Methylobacterium crusticola]GJD53918.1 hypothetical protein OPKNFCMD_6697 [Methylobacterium crusticola]